MKFYIPTAMVLCITLACGQESLSADSTYIKGMDTDSSQTEKSDSGELNLNSDKTIEANLTDPIVEGTLVPEAPTFNLDELKAARLEDCAAYKDAKAAAATKHSELWDKLQSSDQNIDDLLAEFSNSLSESLEGLTIPAGCEN